MNQKQNNQAKKLWKDIKTHKNKSDQEVPEHFSMPDPVKKESQASKGRGFYSDDFMRQDVQLKHLQDRYSVPNSRYNSPEINQEVQQINIEQALQANNQDSEAQMIFGRQAKISDRNSIQDQKKLRIDNQQKIRFQSEEKKVPLKQESVVEEIEQIRYLTEVNEQPMIRSMSDNKREENQRKKMAAQKLQRVRQKVRDLNIDMRGIYEQIEQSKFSWKRWIIEKFHQQINQFLQSSRTKNSRGVDERLIEKLKDQIHEIQQSSKTMIALLEGKVDQQIRQNSMLRIQADTMKQKINYLEKQLDSSQDQNLKLVEQLFDSQQRIAQIDLQIEQRLRQLYLHEGNDKAQSIDKQHYLKQIKQLETNLQMISQKYQMQSGHSSSIKKIKEMEQQLNEKQYALKVQQEEIQSNYVEIENKKNELNLFFEQLKLKEAQLRFQEKKLFKKLEELEEKEAQILKISDNMKNNRKPELDYSYQGRENVVDSKNYYLRDEVKQSPQYERNFRQREDLNTTHRKDLDYEIFSQKSNSRSRDNKNAYRSRHKHTPIQPSRNQRQLKLGQSGGGINKSRASSSNTRTNNRLHDLGSKLERLREEIRKQIHEAR